MSGWSVDWKSGIRPILGYDDKRIGAYVGAPMVKIQLPIGDASNIAAVCINGTWFCSVNSGLAQAQEELWRANE